MISLLKKKNKHDFQGEVAMRSLWFTQTKWVCEIWVLPQGSDARKSIEHHRMSRLQLSPFGGTARSQTDLDLELS